MGVRRPLYKKSSRRELNDLYLNDPWVYKMVESMYQSILNNHTTLEKAEKVIEIVKIKLALA